MDLPPNCKVIRNRWVFSEKSDARKPAHLVAKGFSQIEGIDYEEIFSPMIHYETIVYIPHLPLLPLRTCT